MSRRLGERGERAAAAWYAHHGYHLMARNWRDGRRGELDLVLARGGVVVFCEVKTRSTSTSGSGVQAVTRAKQRQVRRLAVAWLAKRPEHWDRVRFDVADVDGRGHVRIFEDCF